MRRFLLFLVAFLLPSIACGAPFLKVVVEDGKPVERFEVMLHTADQGYQQWEAGAKGTFDLSIVARAYGKSATVDVLVRADGHASTMKSFRNEAKEELLNGDATIVLERGRKVRLRLQLPPGTKLPEDALPQVYFPELASRVEMMWQPQNLRGSVPDFNMLNARPTDNEGEFAFRLPRHKREFFVAIYHPGWLRYFRAGPFSAEDFADGVLTVDVPRPAAVEAQLDMSSVDGANLLFNRIHYNLMWKIPGRSGAYLSAASAEKPVEQSKFTATDLAPGEYMLLLNTRAEDTPPDRAAGEIDPAQFMDRCEIELRPGQKLEVDMPFVPFDPDAYRGKRTVEIKVLNQDGSPAVGKTAKVTYFDGHYGALTVPHTADDGPVPDDGIVRLKGITARQPPEWVPYPPYAVEVNDQPLGGFHVAAVDELQRFEFRVPPQVGDPAPDIEIVDVRTGKTSHLTDKRGRIVFVEFWATWCGPCQPAMVKLNELAAAHRDEWGDRVTILPISVDENRELVLPHVEPRGWTHLEHYWSSGGKEPGFFSSPAAEAYGVNGVPTAFLIDRDGTIIWRGHPGGHPASFDLVKEIAKLRTE